METQTIAELRIPPAQSGSYRVRSGNLVRPLIDGERAFTRICEAVEAAQHSVYVTVAFIEPDFEMPGGRGSVFDVLDRAAARGLDVRAIFWRNNAETAFVEHEIFSGRPHQLEALSSRKSGFKARWDRAQKGYCHHQKSWIIDAGEPSETAFVGGINLGRADVVSPGHRITNGEPQTHDIYVEVAGPAATDVHHNFVQRWNEASDRSGADGRWGHAEDDDLAFPTRLSEEAGGAAVQIQRTVRAGQYANGVPAPAAAAFDIAAGEFSIHEQYGLAISSARRSIYIENQSLGLPATLTQIARALDRGVWVTVLTPADAESQMRAARKRPESAAFFEQLSSLGTYERFTFAGIAGAAEDGSRHNVYVHAKIMLIDDEWGTIGSCNIASRSFFGDTEMNATFWDPEVVRTLRCDLLEEHLGIETSTMDDAAAMARYREVAIANRQRRKAGDMNWQGNAFALDPATYAS